MLKIEKGGTYKVFRARSGEGDTGPWEIIVVKEEGRTRREITIFPSNVPSGVMEGGSFKVEEITSVRPRKKKDKSGNWTNSDMIVIEAALTPVSEVEANDLFAGYGGYDTDDLL